MHIEFLDTLQYVARGGGGGSGSGDSGGGGEFFALIGYVPSYYLGKLVKKLLPRQAELIVSITFATVISLLIFGFGAINGFLSAYIAVLVIIGIWAGWAAAFFDVWDKIRKRAKQAKKVITAAAQKDSTWNETALRENSKQTFLKFQRDWSSFNTANFSSYMTQPLAKRNYMLLRVLQELRRTNRMEDVQILEALITEARDSPDNNLDSYVVAFKARAKDELIDDTTNAVLFTDNREFTEYWRFIRDGNNWLLHDIAQETADPSALNDSLRQFASKNSLQYSSDMGWLFLPRKGALFTKGGKFGKSDINNHAVGTYNEHLVQLYTYQPRVSNSDPTTYMIAQINLPKSYGGIIIERDKSFLKKTLGGSVPSGYQKYEFEWPDFNKRYDVFATEQDRLATFELLNPSFMAYLYDTDPGISLEVTDNIVYLYKNVKLAVPADYEKMMTILNKAFKELQL